MSKKTFPLLVAGLSMWLGAYAASSASGIPAVLAGNWVISSVEGDAPAFLQVRDKEDLIGRHVVLSADHVALWSVYDGHPDIWNEKAGSLASVLSVPDAVRKAASITDPDAVLDIYEVSLNSCASEGKVLTVCPVLLFAFNRSTQNLSLVTYPFGLAHLRKLVQTSH